MKIHNAQFVKSSTGLPGCPDPDRHEYAFIGRSNVGKSSLINMLVDKKNMAKTSGKPGKTTLINHFIINTVENDPTSGWYLVDLPGYGYASTAKTERKKWSDFTKSYLRRRLNLLYLFVLIDSRLEAQKIDLEFMSWLGEQQIAFGIVFTKVDKMSNSAMHTKINAYKKRVKETWAELPNIYITSAEKKVGRDEILDLIEETNKIPIEIDLE